MTADTGEQTAPERPADPLAVLELAQHFAGLARQISVTPRDPHNLVAERQAGAMQHQYAQMAAQLALVSIAESLDAVLRLFATKVEESTSGSDDNN